MTTTVDCYFVTPNGDPLANTTVEFQPTASGFQDEVTGILSPSYLSVTTDENGEVTVQLFPSPVPYTVTVLDGESVAYLSYEILVPVSALTHRLQDLIIVTPEVPAADWITAHLAAADPHPGYVLESTVGSPDGLATLDAAGKIPLSQLPSGLSGGGCGVGGDSTETAVLARQRVVQFAASDETTALTTGLKIKLRMPYGLSAVVVRASLNTAQASGSIFTVDIKRGDATSIFTTKLTINNTSKTSVGAATPAVIVTALTLNDDEEISVYIDQIGDGTAVGLKFAIYGEVVVA